MELQTPSSKIKRVTFSKSHAPLTPLRQFKPTPIKVKASPKDGPQTSAARLILASPINAVDVGSTVLIHSEEPDAIYDPTGGIQPDLENDNDSLQSDGLDRNNDQQHSETEESANAIASPTHYRNQQTLCSSGSESDVGWTPGRRRAAVKTRRVILSDSESDCEPIAGPSKRSTAINVIDLTGSDDSVQESDEADVEEDDDVVEYTLDDKAWKEKYYDDSIGSLEDFIVDDDDEDDGTGSESSDEDLPKLHQPIPATVHQSDDDVSDGILHYSPPPRKVLEIPDLGVLTITSDSEDEAPRPSKHQSTTPASKGKSKKEWEADRVRIANGIFAELDRKVFDNKLGSKGAGAGIEWNNRLLTTAGTANHSKKRNPDGTVTETAKIVLSMKVCTGKEQILSTVAHEMCHLASWLISNERKNPHGRVFKSWGRKVMRARPDIEVTTKHTYEIEYKYQWKCVNEKCAKIYKRHSKSIDPKKHACSRCRAKLEPMFTSKKETQFQVYLRENMANAKTAMPGASHGEVMRALSRQWTGQGPEADHQAFWKAAAAK